MKKIYIAAFLLFCNYLITSAQLGWTEVGGSGNNALNANAAIYSICTDTSGGIFAGGAFTDGSSKNYVARYNGTSWINDFDGAFNGNINSIVWYPATGPYAGGNFTNSEGHNYVAYLYFTGVSFLWNELDSLGANGTIRDLSVDAQGDITAVGDFTNSTGKPYVARNIANHNSWAEIGSNTPFDVGSGIYAYCEDAAGNLYTGGTFIDANDYEYVAADSGTGAWVKAGLDFTGSIKTLCAANDYIYAGGNFTDLSGNHYVAVYQGGVWQNMGNHFFNGAINCICADPRGYIYVGGAFTNDSGNYYVAAWNGNSWSELGAGIYGLKANGTINSITVDNNDNVFAAGDFTDINGKRYVAEYTQLTAGITGVENNADVHIFPNPATGIINISCSGQSNGTPYKVADLLGNVLHSGTLTGSQTRVDISALANGIYLVTVGNLPQSFKIIKGN